MLAKVKISDTQVDKLLKQMCIIVDKREQENSDILAFFKKKGIPYVSRKLEFGDYSVELQACPELGLPFSLSLENRVAIELKHSGESGLDEITTNFTKGRTAFENEFIRARKVNAYIYLLISNGSWEDIDNHNYLSEMNEKALCNSLLSWERQYGIHIHFVKEKDLGKQIHRILAVNLKKCLEE